MQCEFSNETSVATVQLQLSNETIRLQISNATDRLECSIETFQLECLNAIDRLECSIATDFLRPILCLSRRRPPPNGRITPPLAPMITQADFFVRNNGPIIDGSRTRCLVTTMRLSHTQENHPLSNQIDRTPCMPHLLKQ
jgi:hypothetical protein